MKALIEPLFTLNVIAHHAQAVDRALESIERVGLDREVLKGFRTN